MSSTISSSLSDESITSDKEPEVPQTYTDTETTMSFPSSKSTKYHHLLDSDPELEPVERIYTTGSNREYIIIGRQKFLRSDLMEAFGGDMNPGLMVPPSHHFANPAPLGLCAFALTTFVLCTCTAKAQGITITNVVVGPAMFYGGIVQVMAGIWEIACENTFGGTALSSYGGFWMSYGAINIPWFGIQDAYKGNEEQFANAMGFYLLAWSIFTYGLCICTMKSTVMFFLLFFLLGHTFLLLSIGSFSGKEGITRAGGILGIVVAFVAWYNAFAGITEKHNSYVVLGSIPLPSNERHI